MNGLHSERVTEALARSAREAFERGAFDVPTFFVGARMFWGNDRLALFATHWRSSSPDPA